MEWKPSSFLNPDYGYASMSVILAGASALVFAACPGDCERYRYFKMNSVTSRNPSPAFSLVELLVVAAILVVLVLLLRPVNPGRRNSAGVVCMSNLKQTVLGFVMWSDDNGGSWPWQVSINNGGTLELIPNGLAAVHFLTLSNYLKDPRLLACPTDRARTATNNYSSFDNQNLSYFAGLDAIASSSNSSLSILSGDRHLQVNDSRRRPVCWLYRTPGLGVGRRSYTRKALSRPLVISPLPMDMWNEFERSICPPILDASRR